jgi:hypothetical protein
VAEPSFVGGGCTTELVVFDIVFFDRDCLLEEEGEEGKKDTDFFLGEPGAALEAFSLADFSFFGESAWCVSGARPLFSKICAPFIVGLFRGPRGTYEPSKG